MLRIWECAKPRPPERTYPRTTVIILQKKEKKKSKRKRRNLAVLRWVDGRRRGELLTGVVRPRGQILSTLRVGQKVRFLRTWKFLIPTYKHRIQIASEEIALLSNDQERKKQP